MCSLAPRTTDLKQAEYGVFRFGDERERKRRYFAEIRSGIRALGRCIPAERAHANLVALLLIRGNILQHFSPVYLTATDSFI